MNARHRPARRPATAAALLALVPALSLLVGCDDFFGSGDLKAVIAEDVAEATAETTLVEIRAASDSMGVPSPYGDDVEVKVGVPTAVTTTVDEDWTFSGWTFAGGSAGDVSFEDPARASTRMTVARDVAGLRIVPTFDRRPYPLEWDPYTGVDQVITNKEIAVTFSEAVDLIPSDLAAAGRVQVLTRSYKIAGDPYIHVESSLAMSVSGPLVTISPSGGFTFEPYHTVLVIMSGDVRDMDGHAMAGEFSWFFKTGSSEDSDPPLITGFTVINAVGAESADGAADAYTNGRTIRLNVEAVDGLQDVWDLRVFETTYDEFGAVAATATHDLDYASSVQITLAATGQVRTKFSVQAADNSGNWSPASETAANTRNVWLDTSPPLIGSFPLPATTRLAAQSVAVTASDPGSAGPLSYAVTGTGVGTPYSGSSATAAFTLSAGDGSKAVRLTVTDAAGNSTFVDDSVVYDGTRPTTPVLSPPPNHDGYFKSATNTYWHSGGGVTFALSSTDGSGITGYTTDPAGVSPAPDPTPTLSANGTLYAVDTFGNVSSSGLPLLVSADAAPPSISGFPLATATNSFAQSVTAVASDAGSGIATYTVSGSGVATPYAANASAATSFALSTGDGDKTVTLTVTDAVGNEASQNYSIKLDRTGPVVTSFPAPAATNSTAIGATVVANDGSGVGIATYAVAGAGVLTPYAANASASTSFALKTGDGDKEVVLTVLDSLGNPTTVTRTIDLDTLVPTITGFLVATPTADLAHSVTASGDGTGTALANYAVTGAGLAAGGGYSGASASTTFTLSAGDGNKAITLTVTDAAGNTKSQNYTVVLDQSGPTALTFPLPATTDDPSVSVAASATDPRGIGTYAVGGSGVLTAYGPAASGSTTFTLTAGDGAKEVILTVTDALGNPSQATYSIILDQDPPGAPGVASHDGYLDGASSTYWHRGGGVEFTLSSDPGDGTAIAGYTTDPAGLVPAPAATVTLSSDGTVYAVDGMGHVSVGTSLTVSGDADYPAVTGTLDGTTKVITGFSAEDPVGGSGLDPAGYSVISGSAAFEDLAGVLTLTVTAFPVDTLTPKTYEVAVKDLAGNSTKVTVVHTKVDNTPTYSATISATAPLASVASGSARSARPARGASYAASASLPATATAAPAAAWRPAAAPPAYREPLPAASAPGRAVAVPAAYAVRPPAPDATSVDRGQATPALPTEAAAPAAAAAVAVGYAVPSPRDAAAPGRSAEAERSAAAPSGTAGPDPARSVSGGAAALPASLPAPPAGRGGEAPAGGPGAPSRSVPSGREPLAAVLPAPTRTTRDEEGEEA